MKPDKQKSQECSKRVVYVNGHYVAETEASISIFDSAAMFGDLVFEMTRSFNRRQFKLREHLERLFRSAKMLQIPFPMSIDEMAKIVEEVVERNRPCMDADDEDRVMINLSRGILSLYHPIFGGDPGPTLIVSSFPLSLTLAAFAGIYDQGIHAVIPSQRAIPADLLDPKIKNRSRLHYMTANLQVSQVPDPLACGRFFSIPMVLSLKAQELIFSLSQAVSFGHRSLATFYAALPAPIRWRLQTNLD